ncbi:MAG: hypothetical protein PHQ53_00810 [Candidatus Krumholzibacteria bacterium]|nr:hypothetical protein [Candidatus Krumholzibacteria bacterium]
MPLTDFQAALGRLLAANRSEDSYLAGAAAMLAAPNTHRFSHDLDYFHDSAERVASAFAADHRLLVESGYIVETEISQPGYIRVIARRQDGQTKIEWAQDSTWRFMPVIRSEEFGYQLHPIDLATNKVLALAGRDEARDLLDTVHLHEKVLPLGALVWASVGKDPGYAPLSLLEMLRRRGKVQPADLARLDLAVPVDLTQLKTTWNSALDSAETFVRSRPPQEAGCLYYSLTLRRFVSPDPHDPDGVATHFGRPGGVLPRLLAE